MEWFAPSLLQQQTTFWWRAAGQQKLCLLRSLPRCCGSLGPHSPTHQSIHSFLHFVNKLPSFRNSFKLIDCWFIHFLMGCSSCLCLLSWAEPLAVPPPITHPKAKDKNSPIRFVDWFINSSIKRRSTALH